MKTYTISRTALMALLISIISTSSVYAWGRCGRGPFGMSPNDALERLMDLTSEQKEQLAALRQQFIDDTAKERIGLNTALKNLDILIETSEPDRKAIKSLVKEITDLKATLLEKQIHLQLEVKKVAPELAENMFPRCQKGERFCCQPRCGGKPDFSPAWCSGRR